jgi:hypothetical protein
MRAVRLRRTALVMLATCASLGTGPARNADQILAHQPVAVRAALEKQKVLVVEDLGGERDGARSFIVAWVIFERARSEVLARLREAERQPEYRPELGRVQTVEHFENGRVDEQRLRILFTDFVYRLRYTEDPVTERLEWRLDPRFDNDLKAVEGFWELYPYGSNPRRTLARFGSHVDVGSAVPRFVQRGLSRSTVLRYVENTRRWVDSGGTWRP